MSEVIIYAASDDLIEVEGALNEEFNDFAFSDQGDGGVMDDNGQYIRDHYAVPADRGRRILFRGKPGVIVGFDDARLVVVLRGSSEPVPMHPTWEVDYSDEVVPVDPLSVWIDASGNYWFELEPGLFWHGWTMGDESARSALKDARYRRSFGNVGPLVSQTRQQVEHHHGAMTRVTIDHAAVAHG
jgi:hypothetical protein